MADNQQNPQIQGDQTPVPPNAPKIEGLGAQVGNTAKQAASDVTKQAATAAQEAGKQAANAAQEATRQAADLAKQAAQQATQQASVAVNAGLQQGVDKLKQINVKDFLQPKPGQPKVSNEEKIWGMVSYIPMVSLLALLIRSDSNYIKLHGRQGLLVFVIFFLCIFLYIIPWIGVPLASLMQFLLFVLGIFSMYQAFLGNWWKIPVLGDLADQIPMSFFSKMKEAATGMPADPNAAKQPSDQSNQNTTT